MPASRALSGSVSVGGALLLAGLVVLAACNDRGASSTSAVEMRRSIAPQAEPATASAPTTKEPAPELEATFTARIITPDGQPFRDGWAFWTLWAESGISMGGWPEVADDGRTKLPIRVRGVQLAVGCRALGSSPNPTFGTLRTEVPKDAADGYELRMPRDHPVAGSVVDDTGAPLDFAQVCAFIPGTSYGEGVFYGKRDPVRSAFTNEDGEFEIRGLDADPYAVGVLISDDFEPPAEVTVSGGTRSLRIVASRRMRPEVVVLDPAGRPLEFVQVWWGPLSAWTDKAGRAQLPGVPRGTTSGRLEVVAGGDFAPFSEERGIVAETVVRLARRISIHGQVTARDGALQGRSDVWYRATGPDRQTEPWRRVRTDDLGRFSLVRLEPGDYELVADAATDSPDVTRPRASATAVVVTPATAANAELRLGDVSPKPHR